MNKKFLSTVLIALFVSACNIGRTPAPQMPPTEAASLAPTAPEVVPSEAVSSPTSTPEPSGIFRLAILVDTTSEPVTREQAQALIEESSQILYGLTGFVFEMTDFQEIDIGGATRDMVQSWLNTSPAITPNGIILFSFGDDGMAKLYGGYAYTYIGPQGFRNEFVAPGAIEQDLYVGVVHFGHRFGQCGYGDSDTPVSNVSIGGECRGVEGTACTEKYGYQMCATLVDELSASTPTYFASSTFVHEIMHPFGHLLNKDHYFTAECTEVMNSGVSTRPYQADAFDSDEADYYVNMCPYVYDNFVNSYNP